MKPLSFPQAGRFFWAFMGELSSSFIAPHQALLNMTSTTHTYPFLAPWKKNLTMNTCRPAIVTIITPSTILKLNIRRSVLLTVLKLRFSRVRKYFWLRLIVESCDESLRMDSSSADCWSGVLPCLLGSWARASFSTFESGWSASNWAQRW